MSPPRGVAQVRAGACGENLPAVAWGTVWLNGVNVAPEADEGASLEQIKSSCMEIGYPH